MLFLTLLEKFELTDDLLKTKTNKDPKIKYFLNLLINLLNKKKNHPGIQDGFLLR